MAFVLAPKLKLDRLAVWNNIISNKNIEQVNLWNWKWISKHIYSDKYSDIKKKELRKDTECKKRKQLEVCK